VFVGRDVLTDARIAQTLAAFEGRPRVWFLFTHVAGRDGGPNDERRMVRALDRAGRRLGAWHETGAALYLYDLGRDPD
jgi:hypothetical protein